MYDSHNYIAVPGLTCRGKKQLTRSSNWRLIEEMALQDSNFGVDAVSISSQARDHLALLQL
jgi:hypothetical protein